MLILGLVIIRVFLAALGFLYAWIIYKSPLDRTWVEVFWGVLGTIFGIVASQVFVYAYLGELPWWTILFVPEGFMWTGSSQIIFQEYKFRKQRQKGAEVENEYNGNEGY